MSLGHSAGINNKPLSDSTHDSPSNTASITVADHAKLRYRQRVDAAAFCPADRLRELFERGQPAPKSEQVDEGRARRTDDWLVVYKETESNPTIVTIFRARDFR
jgi:hypothetical protein